jgi:16S rRNA (uracil1498-N3)-methyltransferase
MRSSSLFIGSRRQTGQHIVLDNGQSHYLRHVMRLSKGDEVIIFNGEGGEYTAVLEQLGKSGTICRLVAHRNAERELLFPVHVIQATCRSEKIDTVLQKCTELGATSFQLVVSDRAQLKLTGNRLENRLGRWRRIIIEAAEQSGRTRLPTLEWRSALKDVQFCGPSYILHPEAVLSWALAKTDIRQAEEISIAIGPEGGWTSHDVSMLQDSGAACLGFGPRTLRTETAAPALLAAIQAVKDE